MTAAQNGAAEDRTYDILIHRRPFWKNAENNKQINSSVQHYSFEKWEHWKIWKIEKIRQIFNSEKLETFQTRTIWKLGKCENMHMISSAPNLSGANNSNVAQMKLL